MHKDNQQNNMRQAIVIKNPKWELFTTASDAFKSASAPSILVVRGRCKEKKLKDTTGAKMNWQALAVFVGVPLPGTGAWTGAAIGVPDATERGCKVASDTNCAERRVTSERIA
jgi:hypothetical protein